MGRVAVALTVALMCALAGEAGRRGKSIAAERQKRSRQIALTLAPPRSTLRGDTARYPVRIARFYRLVAVHRCKGGVDVISGFIRHSLLYGMQMRVRGGGGVGSKWWLQTEECADPCDRKTLLSMFYATSPKCRAA